VFPIIARFEVDVESYDLKVLKTLMFFVAIVALVAVVALVLFVASNNCGLMSS